MRRSRIITSESRSYKRICKRCNSATPRCPISKTVFMKNSASPFFHKNRIRAPRVRGLKKRKVRENMTPTTSAQSTQVIILRTALNSSYNIDTKGLVSYMRTYWFKRIKRYISAKPRRYLNIARWLGDSNVTQQYIEN